jgi:hypothetical protein
VLFFTKPSTWGETELGASSRPNFVTATEENFARVKKNESIHSNRRPRWLLAKHRTATNRTYGSASARWVAIQLKAVVNFIEQSIGPSGYIGIALLIHRIHMIYTHIR